jgi:hypothetical protein
MTKLWNVAVVGAGIGRIQITEGYNALPHISFACSHRVTSIPNGCMS